MREFLTEDGLDVVRVKTDKDSTVPDVWIDITDETDHIAKWWYFSSYVPDEKRNLEKRKGALDKILHELTSYCDIMERALKEVRELGTKAHAEVVKKLEDDC